MQQIRVFLLAPFTTGFTKTPTTVLEPACTATSLSDKVLEYEVCMEVGVGVPELIEAIDVLSREGCNCSVLL